MTSENSQKTPSRAIGLPKLQYFVELNKTWYPNIQFKITAWNN